MLTSAHLSHLWTFPKTLIPSLTFVSDVWGCRFVLRPPVERTVQIDPTLKPIAQPHHAVQRPSTATAKKEEINEARPERKGDQDDVFETFEPELYLKNQQVPNNGGSIDTVFNRMGSGHNHTKES